MDTLNAIERGQNNNHDRLHVMIDSANPALTHEMITKVLQSERVSNAVAGQYLILWYDYCVLRVIIIFVCLSIHQ